MRSQLFTPLRSFKPSSSFFHTSRTRIRASSFFKLQHPMSGIPSETAHIQQQANMSTSTSTSPSTSSSSALAAREKELDIKSTVNVATGVNLSKDQRIIVGSILDLFAGHPTLPKLSLWSQTATFSDPLTIATGYKQFAAQWYGLAAAFSTIEQQHSSVTSAGNPIELDLKTRYVVKGLGSEQVICSKVKIWTEGDKIEKVEDRWDGKIPEGVFAKTFRNLNSVVVPAFVSVPKNKDEDAKKGL